MKSYCLPALFITLVFGAVSLGRGAPTKTEAEKGDINRILGIMGDVGKIKKQSTHPASNSSERYIKIETDRTEIRVTLAPNDSSIMRISRPFEEVPNEQLKWTEAEAAAKAIDFLKRILGEENIPQPDYIYKKDQDDNKGLWRASWTRRIKDYKVLNDEISLNFSEKNELYWFNRRWDVSEDITIPPTRINQEEATKLAYKYGIKVMATNTQRFRSFLLGKVESVDKILLTPTPHFDAAGIMTYRHDSNNLRPAWMFIFNNVEDPSYEGDTVAVPESKLMLWVDAETGEYCGANF